MSKWREQFRVHPAADAFPMMTDDELAELAEDIKQHGVQVPLLLWTDGEVDWLIDGRNRLEAMERAGIDERNAPRDVFTCGTPLQHIISLNLRRRHLTKAEQADVIVRATLAAETAEEKPPQGDAVIDAAQHLTIDVPPPRRNKGGRGKVNKAKAVAVQTAKVHGISKSTVERSFAKAKGKVKAKPKSDHAKDARLKREAALAKDLIYTRVAYARLYVALDDKGQDKEQREFAKAIKEAKGWLASTKRKRAA